MGAPVTLKEKSESKAMAVPKMAEDACRFGNIGGLKVLNADDVKQFRMAQ